MTPHQKPCRHLASISLGKLGDKLTEMPPINLKSCASCPKKTCPDDANTYACLTCLEAFCHPSHLIHHSRERNHPLSFHLQALTIDNDAIEKQFYCSLCSTWPKIREPGKKERCTLEKIRGFFAENQKNLNPSVNLSVDSTAVNTNDDTIDNVPTKISVVPAGLTNLGNTCFMNSALQLLAATVHRHGPLKSTSTSPIWNSLIHHLEQIYSNDSNRSSKKGKASSQYSSSSVVNPREFLSLLSGKQKKFASMQQQDAHDFLRLLFNSVPEAPQNELFAGKFVSRVVCEKCRKVSDTIEPFLDISLSLESPSNNDISLRMSHLSIEDSKEDENINLISLLKHWNKKIVLEGENGYYCESCSPQDSSILQSATLQFFLDPSNLPPFLIFHLQRFKTRISVAKGKGKKSNGMCVEIEKNHETVAFPFNLSIPSECALTESPSNATYQLYGYIIHEGSSTSCGHYTAVVSPSSSADRWYYISDSHVKEISKSRALDGESYCPYLLFYQRIN